MCQENEHLYSKNGTAASVATAAEVLRGNSSKIKEKPATVKRKSAPFAAVLTRWPVQAESPGAAVLCTGDLFIVLYSASELNGQ